MDTGIAVIVYGFIGLLILYCVLWCLVKVGWALLSAMRFIEERLPEPASDQKSEFRVTTESNRETRRHCPGCGRYHPPNRMGRTAQGLYRCATCRRDAQAVDTSAGPAHSESSAREVISQAQSTSGPLQYGVPLRRIAALNIRHGGGTKDRMDNLVARLLSYDADVLVVSDFRANKHGVRLIDELERSGYATSHPGAEATQNSVLIASRSLIQRSWSFPGALDGRHLWCADTTGIAICGVYMPQKCEKLPYWESLILRARRSGIDLCIGDFNTGNNDLDKDPEGSRFIGPEMPGRFIDSGYVDVWRSLHPRRREYSWFSPGAYNGFRIEHAYATPKLARRVSTCEFDQTPRIRGESDHAALIVSLR